MAVSKVKIKKFNAALFRWHKDHYRDMPWRRTHDPYRILVSEIMLQQTQVERVRKKYDEFLRHFPTVTALAHAQLGDVLRVWSGLGYNRRAKFLHECAKQVVNEFGGKFPGDLETLRRLPGIGISTAGALLAFAFDRDVAMIDTNIRRILCRVFFKKKIPSDHELYAFAKTIIPKGKGRMWNYAMLDLGASLCSARRHADECPVAELHGKVGDFIYKKPQKRFAGSTRYYRGRILRLITESHDAEKLHLELDITSGEFNEVVAGLMRDGLIEKRQGRLILPK